MRRLWPAPIGAILRVAGLAVLMSAVAARRALPQEMTVPVDVQVPLLLKILSYDRSLGGSPDALVIGLLYQGHYRTSADAAEQVRRAARNSSQRLEIISLDNDAIDNLDEALIRHRVQVLYVSPMRGMDLNAVRQLSRRIGVRTVTGVPRYVEDGLGIGIDIKGGRPEIMVNLTASRAEGSDLDAQLLKLARIVK